MLKHTCFSSQIVPLSSTAVSTGARAGKGRYSLKGVSRTAIIVRDMFGIQLNIKNLEETQSPTSFFPRFHLTNRTQRSNPPPNDYPPPLPRKQAWLWSWSPHISWRAHLSRSPHISWRPHISNPQKSPNGRCSKGRCCSKPPLLIAHPSSVSMVKGIFARVLSLHLPTTTESNTTAPDRPKCHSSLHLTQAT